MRLLQSGDGIVEVVGARAVVAGTEAEMIEAFDAAGNRSGAVKVQLSFSGD